MALFYFTNDNRLLPVAIQLYQQKGPSNPVIQLMTLDEVDIMIYRPKSLIITEAIGRGDCWSWRLIYHDINWNPKLSFVLLYDQSVPTIQSFNKPTHTFWNEANMLKGEI